MKSYYKNVEDYFNNKANAYDDVDNQLYWVLSDLFFKEILKKEIPTIFKNKKNISILDAGAGTGRWSLFFYELFSKKYKIKGVLVDISQKMLEIADRKISKNKLSKIFSCKLDNIENMRSISNNLFDISLSFYNVLSFTENPAVALKKIFNKLKPGGIHISIVANKYHAYYFSFLTNRIGEIKIIRDKSKVRFNDQMPYIHCFSPEELENMYKKAGFKKIKIIGGPNFIYPGMEETFISGNTESIKKTLSKEKWFDEILKTELSNYHNKDIAGRGNVIMAIAIR